jgi:hypothetical protein
MLAVYCKPKKPVNLVRVLTFSAVIVFVVPLVVLFIFVALLAGSFYGFGSMLVSIPMIYLVVLYFTATPVFLYSLAFVYCYFANRQTLKHSILFSIIFILLVALMYGMMYVI